MSPKNSDLIQARRRARERLIRRNLRHLRNTAQQAAVSCPTCGQRAPLYITREEKELHRSLAPDVVLGAILCAADGCGTFYPIPASAYQQASHFAERRLVRTWFAETDPGKGAP